jgi:hypothetical protein
VVFGVPNRSYHLPTRLSRLSYEEVVLALVTTSKNIRAHRTAFPVLSHKIAQKSEAKAKEAVQKASCQEKGSEAKA